MTIVGAILVGCALAFMAITAGAAAVVRLLTQRNKVAITAGGLLVPASILLGVVVFTFDTDVDGPPPGMVIGGAMLAIAIAAPITMLISYLTVRLINQSSKRTVG